MRGVSFDVLQCATMGHHWASEAPIHRSVTSRTLLLRCTSCGTVRVDDLAPNGDLTYRKYEQSSEYRQFLDGPHGHQSKALYRMEMLKRVRKLRREMKGAA